tara:strand:- start:271 stop:549 length:279 start_codon:yes stop_codon:yes gene_type:complete
MKVDLKDGIHAQEVLYLLCQSFLIMIISFIHPWLAPNVNERVKKKIRNNPVMTYLFVFALAFTATGGHVLQSVLIGFIFFYMKTFLLKLYLK